MTNVELGMDYFAINLIAVDWTDTKQKYGSFAFSLRNTTPSLYTISKSNNKVVPIGIRTRSIISKVMSMRTVVSLVRRKKPSKLSMKIDVNRYCVGITKLYERTTSSGTLRQQSVKIPNDPNSRLDIENLKEVMMDDYASSVIISWSVSEYGDNTQIPPREVLYMERAMKQYCATVTTSRPFFVLDGGGRRMALLSLLGH